MAPSLPSHQGSSCKHTRLRFTNPVRLPRACPTLAAARRVQQTYSSAATGDPGYTAAGDPQQGPDLVSSVLNSCLAATAHLTDQVVTRLADALQTVAPPEAPRSKVEASVKGALVLLLLGLLKGVISFVLLVGCAGLVVYTATQVFGWHGSLLNPADTAYGGGSYYRQQQQQQQYPPRQSPPGQGGYQQGYQGTGGYKQPQAQQGYRQAGPQPHSKRPPGEQGDVVDVWHYPRPA